MTKSIAQTFLRFGKSKDMRRRPVVGTPPRCRPLPLAHLHSRPVGAGGFSLVEVLVAVVVLAVGLLGMASLQLSVLKANDSSRLRTIAIHATYDLIDRMRADPAAVLGSLGLKATLAGNACAGTLTKRWQKDFCAFGLPAPLNANSTNTLEVDCNNTSTTTGCGTGNCRIVVRWLDARGEAKGVTPRNTEFSVCTRVPAV